MKTVITLLGTFFIILIAAILLKKEIDQHIATTEITVMRDITDSILPQPNLKEILSLLNPENSIWDGSNFRFIDISDVSHNYVNETRIAPENPWLANEFDREKKVKEFNLEVSTIIKNAGKEKIHKDNSSVFFPIATELNRLSQSSADYRYLLVYSDLAENTDDFSVYKEKDFVLFQTSPVTIRRYFESQVSLKNLKGIHVYLIYQPSNVHADREYNAIAGFYKKLLEEKGAIVEITANIN